MKKDKIWLFIIIAILIGVGVGTFVKWQINNKGLVGEPVPSQSPNVLNENGWPLFMIDGIIDKIYSVKPLKLDVKVRVSKIFSDQNEEEIVRTITVTEDTQFVLHNLETKMDSVIEPSSFNIGDDVVIWTIEPNSDILQLDQFTATKIIKNQ